MVKWSPYDIFMANVKKVGKDRRGSFIYKKDEKGREIVDRNLYKPFRRINNSGFFTYGRNNW